MHRREPGEDVRRIQEQLHRLGYARSEPDGVFGPQTAAALLIYQHDNGLHAHGDVDDATSAMLEMQCERLTQPTWPISDVLHRPSPNFKARSATARVDTVVVHYTDLPLLSTLEHLTSPATEVSAHFVVDRGGRVFQLVHPDYRAWHAGKSELFGRGDVNDFSVGIDAVFEPPVHRAYTDAQYLSIARLIWELRRNLPLDGDRVVGHEHVALPRGRKADPGPCFDWSRLFRLLDWHPSEPTRTLLGLPDASAAVG